MQKTKYVTNKDLLVEIHRSKVTYCAYADPKYARFDTITDYDGITVENAEALLVKLNNRPRRPRAAAPEPQIESIHELVFRVMTYEHVPLCDDKKKRSRALAGEGHLRVNFPPFKHYRINEDGVVEEVCRSHWQGTLEDGEFSLEHGKMTNRLAQMFMLLVERYGRRGNWRGYCYDTETTALTQRGWLGPEEITLHDKVLSYDMDDGQLKWSKLNNIYHYDYDGLMFKLDIRGMDALVTPGHKFITRKNGLKAVEYLLETDNIVLMGDAANGAAQAKYSDAFVELVGWFVTEGNIYQRSSGTNRVTIYQNEGAYAERIRNCLRNVTETEVTFSEFNVENDNFINVKFTLNKNISKYILEVTNDKRVLPTEFIMSLTSHQRKLLIDTMVDADGWRTKQGNRFNVGYAQKDKEHVDTFLMLCTLEGFQVSSREKEIIQKSGLVTKIYICNFYDKRGLKHCRMENVDMQGAKRNGTIKGRGKHTHPNEPTIPYKGKVWCPSTDYGTVVVKRGAYVYTGANSYNDEMRSSALLQLAQVGLQFDESKGDNPFAFFTTTVSNAFTRVFNLERKNQNIRDDMLVIAGAKPSYTRQVEHELAQKFAAEGVTAAAPVKKIPAKRGRKPKTATPEE